MDIKASKTIIESEFNSSIIPSLMDFIRIPNLSRSYDPNWSSNGLLEKAANHIKSWIESQKLKNLFLELLESQGKTPFLYVEVKGTDSHSPTVLLYGHIDKQPHLEGWEEGLGPISPVIRDGRLYGRGASDDGYAAYAAILAIKTCQEQGVAHGRCVILLECDEESGSQDLPFYLESLRERIGKPSLIICLDSGCSDYSRLWLTTSLRGTVSGVLKIRTQTEEVHSGDASGVIPSNFRILQSLLSRIENLETGEVNPLFQVNIPPERYEEAFQGSILLGKGLKARMPFHKSTKPTLNDDFQLSLNRTWRAQLTVTGIEGLPPPQIAGNVLKPFLNTKLSLRLPPTQNSETAKNDLKNLLEKDPPYNCQVEFCDISSGSGWNSRKISKNLNDLLNKASLGFFGKEFMSQGEGVSIPFMKLLSDLFPEAEMAVIGVLGPKSNAHAPNEFLHLDMCKGVIGCVVTLIAGSEALYRKM